MTPEVSVIVPVYNSSRYLIACLNSIRKQTFENIEILCIDDGSVDSSAEILRFLEKMDSRIRVFYNERNKGQSASRNLGIENAKGRFICFVDSDDIIDESLIKKTLDKIKSTGSEICIFNMQMFDSSGYITDRCYASEYYTNGVCETYKTNVGAVFSSAVLGIYNVSLFENGENRFVEGQIFEDWVFMANLLNSRNIRYCMLDECLYKYRRGIVSTTSRVTEKVFDYFKSYQDSRDAIKRNPNSNYIEYFNDRAFVEGVSGYFFSKIYRSSKDIRIGFLKRLRDILREMPRAYFYWLIVGLDGIRREFVIRCYECNDVVAVDRWYCMHQCISDTRRRLFLILRKIYIKTNSVLVVFLSPKKLVKRLILGE